MVLRHHVEGFENFFEFMKNFKSNESIYILYTGKKLPNGKSWCPDCVEGTIFRSSSFISYIT